jgi:hypothetical protein
MPEKIHVMHRLTKVGCLRTRLDIKKVATRIGRRKVLVIRLKYIQTSRRADARFPISFAFVPE